MAYQLHLVTLSSSPKLSAAPADLGSSVTAAQEQPLSLVPLIAAYRVLTVAIQPEKPERLWDKSSPALSPEELLESYGIKVDP
jgi:hypothetical protein